MNRLTKNRRFTPLLNGSLWLCKSKCDIQFPWNKTKRQNCKSACDEINYQESVNLYGGGSTTSPTDTNTTYTPPPTPPMQTDQIIEGVDNNLLIAGGGLLAVLFFTKDQKKKRK
jgi:hypothetical protein